MGIWKPSFPCSIIKVSDGGYGPSLCRIVSHQRKRIHIQKVSLSFIQGSSTVKDRDLVKHKWPWDNIYFYSMSFVFLRHAHMQHTEVTGLCIKVAHEKQTKQSMRCSLFQRLITITYEIDRQMLENRFPPQPQRHLSFTPFVPAQIIAEDVSQMLHCLLTRLLPNSAICIKDCLSMYAFIFLYILITNAMHFASEYLLNSWVKKRVKRGEMYVVWCFSAFSGLIIKNNCKEILQTFTIQFHKITIFPIWLLQNRYSITLRKHCCTFF